MRKIVTVSVLVFLLAGCVTSSSESRIQSERAACDKLKTAVARVSCEIRVKHENITSGEAANMDLIDLEDAEYVALAAKVDAGQMSVSDANLRFMQVHSQLISEAKKRNNEAEIATSASMATMPTTCNSYNNGAGITATCY